MMSRWLWFAPLAGCTLLVALWAFQLGWNVTATTETDVIRAYAQKYLDDRVRDGTADGAKVTDCVAYPGADKGVWLRIVCDPSPADGAQRYAYEVDRFGQLVQEAAPENAHDRSDGALRPPET